MMLIILINPPRKDRSVRRCLLVEKLTDCSSEEKLSTRERKGWLGWKDYSALPHPFGAVRGASAQVTARTNQPPQRDRQHWPLHRAPRTLSFPSWHSPRATRERFLWLMPSDIAGVERFEASNGGGKNPRQDRDNQQVAETTDRRVPSSPFDSPSLPPNLPPAIGETAVVLRPARGTTNYLLLSANLRHPTGPCHVTPVRPQARRPERSEGVAESRTSSHQSRKGAALGKPLSHPGGT